MLDWIQDNREEFLCHFTEIGEDLDYAVELREEHKQFEENCGVSLSQLWELPFSTIFALFLP